MTMHLDRIIYLIGENNAERLSYGEIAEIQEAFDELDPATLRDEPENATAGDMLEELLDQAPRCKRPKEHDASRETVTCGECNRSWCDACYPTHGPRCYFETIHDDPEQMTTCEVCGAEHVVGEDCPNYGYGEYHAEPEVTDAQRVAYTLHKMRGWLEHLEANAKHAEEQDRPGVAHEIRGRAEELRDVLRFLDGTEDDYIKRWAAKR